MKSEKCKVQSFKQKGLTLIEVLIAIGISVAVGALLVVIIINSAGLYSKETNTLSEGLNINDALSKIRNTVKDASVVASTYIDGSTTYTSGSTQLVLKIPAVDSLNNIISNTFDYFVFFQDSNKLRFKTFPNSQSSRKPQDQIFSTSLDNLNFQYFDLSTPPSEVSPVSCAKVRISLKLKQSIATSEANLRND